MRLLISAGLFHPSTVGGPSKTLYWLAKSLVNHGVTVSVVTTSKYIINQEIEFDKWLNIDQIRVRYCEVKGKISFSTIYHGIKEMQNCQSVVLSSMFYMPSFFIAFFALVTKKKIIWSPRGELFEAAINKRSIKLIYLKFLKLFFSRSVIFHATSEQEVNAIKRVFGIECEIFVLPNYMNLPKIEERVENENYFLYVGRIAPIKALDKLIKGISKSNHFLNSDFKLKIAGEVESQFNEYFLGLKSLLRSLPELNDKVFFTGNVIGANKNKLYANAYFSLLVSESENFGNVVIESLSQGTPVIASHGTPWETLKTSNSGFWIENDPKEIAKIIDIALNLSIMEYGVMRKNAFDLSKEFDVDLNINKWIAKIGF